MANWVVISIATGTGGPVSLPDQDVGVVKDLRPATST
jgi:hypothetical protein